MENYTLFDKIGSGSFAEVYKCLDRINGNWVALKVVNKKSAGVVGIETARGEAQILSDLKHPHIIKFYEVFETASAIHLVLELLSGLDLFDQVCRLQRYDEGIAARLIYNVTCALDYMHDKKICHRDIKPENLMLRQEVANLNGTQLEEALSNVTLADFGLATRFVPGEFTLTSICGTPEYMPPEMVSLYQGRRERGYSESCDLWSLGIVTYILLCGWSPFAAETQSRVFQIISSCDISFPNGSIWDKISDEAKDFVSKLLRRDPTGRMTARDALLHPWLFARRNQSFRPHLQESITALRRRSSSKPEILTGVLMASSSRSNTGFHSESGSEFNDRSTESPTTPATPKEMLAPILPPTSRRAVASATRSRHQSIDSQLPAIFKGASFNRNDMTPSAVVNTYRFPPIDYPTTNISPRLSDFIHDLPELFGISRLDPVGKASTLMRNEGLSALATVHESNGVFMGLVDSTAILSVAASISSRFKSGDVPEQKSWLPNLRAAPPNTIDDGAELKAPVMNFIINASNISTPPNRSLQSVVRLMADKRLQHMVILGDANVLLTQGVMLRLLQRQGALVRCTSSNYSVDELGIVRRDLHLTVLRTTPAWQAVLMLKGLVDKNEEGSLAVVDNDGRLVMAFTPQDVCGLNADNLSSLGLTIEKFIQKIRVNTMSTSFGSNLPTCNKQSLVSEVITCALSSPFPMVFITNNASRPIGVVTFTSLLKLLIS